MDTREHDTGEPRDPDGTLLAELRRLASELDPLPSSLAYAARESLTWRRVDAELAELLADSVESDPRLELVRGANRPRAVSFESPRLTIELEIIGSGRWQTIVGQLVPPGTAEIEVQSEEAPLTTSADGHGRFRVEGVPAGHIRLRLTEHPSTPRPVETSWIAV